MKKTFLSAFVKTLPVMGTYIILGIGFGMLLEKGGYGVLWAFAMGVFIYAGAMQYVAVGLLTSGAAALAAAFTTFTVNARHFFYGVSMIERYKDTGKFKPYLYFALTDETYSLVCTDDIPEGVDRNRFYFLLSLLNQCYWVFGCVTGSLLGAASAFDSSGIEFVMTALFVTVFLEQWMSGKNHLFSLTGVGLSLVCLILFGSDYFLIPSMIITILFISLYRKKHIKKEAE